MAEITRHLSYNDIKLLKKNTNGKSKITEYKEEKQSGQKEIQD